MIVINIDEMKNILELKNICNQIMGINVVNYKIVSSINLNEIKELKEHIQQLEKSINSNKKNEKVLKQIEALIDNIEELKIEDLITINKERETIFSYIYWKYKNQDNSLTVHLGKLKKVLMLGQESKDKYIKPVIIKIICNCGKYGDMYIYNYEKNFVTFKCKFCSHEEEYCNDEYKHNNLFKICKCKICTQLREQFYHLIKNNLRNWFEYMVRTVENSLDFSEDYTLKDDEMRMDYKIYSSCLDKDEREVMVHNPKNLNDLENIFEKLIERSSRYNSEYDKYEVFRKLIDNRVIYKVKNIIDTEELHRISTEIVANECININDMDNKKIFDEFLCFIENSDINAFYKNFGGIIFFNFKRYLVLGFHSLLEDEIRIERVNKYFEDDFIFNKYYFSEEKPSFNKFNNVNIVKNIFDSNSEKSIYVNINNKYKGYIILPKYPIIKIIDLSKFRGILKDKELDYLERCTLNFVICTQEGELVKVIELKKGTHHNEKAWSEKDALKEYVIKSAGVEFEEYF